MPSDLEKVYPMHWPATCRYWFFDDTRGSLSVVFSPSLPLMYVFLLLVSRRHPSLSLSLSVILCLSLFFRQAGASNKLIRSPRDKVSQAGTSNKLICSPPDKAPPMCPWIILGTARPKQSRAGVNKQNSPFSRHLYHNQLIAVLLKHFRWCNSPSQSLVLWHPPPFCSTT